MTRDPHAFEFARVYVTVMLTAFAGFACLWLYVRFKK